MVLNLLPEQKKKRKQFEKSVLKQIRRIKTFILMMKKYLLKVKEVSTVNVF